MAGGSQREVEFYETAGAGKVRCGMCPHRCLIREGKQGICRVRRLVDGRLLAVNYGLCTSLAVDPIEKKPLYHFYPGAEILSAGTFGCNLSCGFCQNWEISQEEPDSVYIEPERLVKKALAQDSIGIAYTYSEPMMWYEYVLDTAPLARKAGLVNVLVTNGYVNEEPLGRLLPYIDAMNIDVKGFGERFYRELCGGSLSPVLRTVERAHKAGCHVEVTNLVVTGENDSDEDLHRLVEWLAGVSPDIPLHLSRYFPNYRFREPPTPVETLKRAETIAKERLRYVYLGNLPGDSDTTCPGCGHLLVKRRGYRTQVAGISEGKCEGCGRDANIIIQKDL